MTTDLVDMRLAEPSDCDALAAIHSAAWLGAYRGLLNGVELDRLIARRPPDWWRRAMSKGVRIKVICVAGETAGYATFGTCRIASLPYEGEIYELYLKPKYQGLGFGRRLFQTIRSELAETPLNGLAVQVLSANQPAREFYQALGGKLATTSSYRSANSRLELSVYAWPGNGQT